MSAILLTIWKPISPRSSLLRRTSVSSPIFRAQPGICWTDRDGPPNIRPLNEGVWYTTGSLEFESDGSMGAIIVPDRDGQTAAAN